MRIDMAKNLCSPPLYLSKNHEVYIKGIRELPPKRFTVGNLTLIIEGNM
jgi:hypothetical protein